MNLVSCLTKLWILSNPLGPLTFFPSGSTRTTKYEILRTVMKGQKTATCYGATKVTADILQALWSRFNIIIMVFAKAIFQLPVTTARLYSAVLLHRRPVPGQQERQLTLSTLLRRWQSSYKVMQSSVLQPGYHPDSNATVFDLIEFIYRST